MSRRVEFTSQAKKTLENIFENSASEWGEKNATQYLQRIVETLDYLADHPTNGNLDEKTGVHQYLIQLKSKAFGHYVYYQFEDDLLVVLAFKHSQNPTRPVFESFKESEE